MRVHSEVGIITNSSSEIFSFISITNKANIVDLVNKLNPDKAVEVVVNPLFVEQVKELATSLGDDAYYREREALEAIENECWEDAWYYLKYSHWELPYPILVKVDGEDITDLLTSCVSSEELGNE